LLATLPFWMGLSLFKTESTLFKNHLLMPDNNSTNELILADLIPDGGDVASWVERSRLIYRAWRYRLRLDRAEIAFVRSRLASKQTAIDIGAHKGAYTYWMQKGVGDSGQVIAFEPQPQLACRLESLRRGFGWRQVTILQAGLSNQRGSFDLHIPRGGPSPGATLTTSHQLGDCDTLQVRVETLDGVLNAMKAGPVSLIKCDVEGHELEVFQGAESVLKTDRPALLFECEERHHADGCIEPVFDYLRSLGYQGYYFHQGRQEPIATFNAEKLQQPGQTPYINNFAFI